ncbi:hypothetical protein [Lacticaseibacillus nasuensis]|uniref:hypothetical protein n=1 Tax=Lacticaseibacillus nasuensis TaxID=944671 RepID=UPI000B1B37E3|nr:hypothetical protein [Lacticaseibacillus nasuensis]
MRDSLIYVHYEPLAHMFATAGVTASDVLTAHSRPWHHLLLLPPVSDDELIDPHTGFNVVSGQQEITTWLRSKEARNRAWLDFRHGPYLQELTPNEIAELLYLAHMRTHIQPPFYYKLQNSLVFIPQKKVSWRRCTFGKLANLTRPCRPPLCATSGWPLMSSRFGCGCVNRIFRVSRPR